MVNISRESIPRTFRLKKEQLRYLQERAAREDSGLSQELRKIIRQAQEAETAKERTA
jgi:hypothetical protein